MSDKCKRCGACKECGAVPQNPWPYPAYPGYPSYYPVYPNYVPSWTPGSPYPITFWCGAANTVTYTGNSTT